MFDLEEKRVLVTGAAGSLGSQICAELVSLGARVCMTDRQGVDLATAAERLEQAGGAVMHRQLDVTDPGGWDRGIEAMVAQWGGIDVLVNNAAIASPIVPIDRRDPEDFATMVAVNLHGPFYGTRAVVPMMQGQGGSIVNIASIAGMAQAQGADPAYAMTKAGLLSLTRVTAAQHAHQNIRANAIAPGPIASEMVRAIYDTPEKLAKRLERVPLGRMADPSDISATVAFLASDRASYITGVTIGVDGGAAVQ